MNIEPTQFNTKTKNGREYYSTTKLDNYLQEMYDGDIVSYLEKMHEHGDVQELVAKVQWDADSAAWVLASKNGVVWNYFTDGTIRNLKVIGHITSDIDLLES